MQPYRHICQPLKGSKGWFWGLMMITYVNWTFYLIWTDKHQKAMEQRLAELEASCRQKEAERVDLELRLTEVKEKLKKSLTGGMLGAPVESKPAIKVQEH